MIEVMAASHTNLKYCVSRASLVAVGQVLLEFLTSLSDTRFVVVGSLDSNLAVSHLWDNLALPGIVTESIAASHYCYLNAPLDPSSAVFLERELPSLRQWQPCSLNPPHYRINSPLSICLDAPIVLLAIGDRFSVLLQADQEIPKPETDRFTPEPIYQIRLIFEPTAIASAYQAFKPQLQQIPSLAADLELALVGWAAQPNAASLQSELALRLIAALDAGRTKSWASDSFTRETQERPPATEAKAAAIYKQPQWLQQERLLHELFNVSNATLGPQVILRRSAEVVRGIFGASRCLIAFYSPDDHRVVWGAIARSPEFLSHDRSIQYPHWNAIAQLIKKHAHFSTWVTDEFPLSVAPSEAASTSPIRSVLSSWIQSHPQHADKWVGGFLSIEQWDVDRVWQPEEMYLLHTVIHQVEQALYQALLYQQAEERIQRAALLHRLSAQIRASLNLSEIFETVAVALGQLVVVDSCTIFQYLSDRKVWQALTEYRASTDTPSALNTVIEEQDHPYSARLQNLEIVQISDARTLQSPLAPILTTEEAGAWLIVPIHCNGQLWGSISFHQSYYPRFWHESELQFLTAVADQLAIAIHQATLYQQIQLQNQTLEAQVAQRTAELEGFFDTLPDYIFVVERQDMRLSFCNHAFARGIGFQDRQQVQGKAIYDCFPSELAEHFAQQNSHVFESGQILHAEESVTLGDSIHHFDTFKVPLRKSSGEVYALLGTSRDITELIKIRQALSERTEQLQDALTAARAASQAKSEFLTTMSHELRTPLTSVIGMSSALQQKLFGPLTGKQAEYIKIIHDSGAHLLQLINDILDLSKIEAGKASLQIGQFSLRAIAEQSLALLREKAKAQKVELISKLDGLNQFDVFLGDERRVKQILLNLLSNAVKFTPAGGTVWLRMQFDGNTALIEVEDTGIGIPEDKQHLLFESFQQIDSALNRKHEGTGLGLALTRQLIEMHNGTIQFSSAVGVGTVFTVHLQAQSPKLQQPTG